MPRFTLTARALADLREIARFTQSRWRRAQRLDYLSMLDACFHRLAADPLLGQDCGDILSGYRKFRAGSHVVFYHLRSAGGIEIVRILHGRMDVESRLSEPNGQ